MIKLHDFPLSGNCYKVRLLLAQLGVRYEKVHVDRAKGGTRTPEFLERFPVGKVPALELEDGTTLTESNAILYYFADGTAYFPADRLQRARVMQWLFWEQYSHQPNIAVLRAWRKLFGIPKGQEAEVPFKEALGKTALAVMEKHLAKQDFFAGAYSIADISLYAYTHMAGEGGFELSPYPAVQRWLERVRAQRGHIPLGG